MRLSLIRVDLHQTVKEVATLQQRLHADVLVEAMDVAEIRAQE
jgi:hypothetical protein